METARQDCDLLGTNFEVGNTVNVNVHNACVQVYSDSVGSDSTWPPAVSMFVSLQFC